MNEQNKSFWVGIFIIATIVVTAGLLLFLKPSVGNEKVTLRVLFSNIAHITKGTRVTYAGKQVGEVKEIRMVRDPREAPADAEGDLYIYELILKVDSSVQVYSYDEITFSTTGLLGEKSVAIIPKATPQGRPPATNITNDILYAQSTDQLEKALTKLTEVAETMEGTLKDVSDFLDENTEDFHNTLVSVTAAMGKIDQFITQTMDVRLVERMESTLSRLDNTFYSIERGEGTLGRLLQSDSLFCQIAAVLCRFEILLSDITNYGLLFQYDKSWQRQRIWRMRQMQLICKPCDLYNAFNQQVSSIECAIARIDHLLQQRDVAQQDSCYPERIQALLQTIENLHCSILNLTVDLN